MRFIITRNQDFLLMLVTRRKQKIHRNLNENSFIGDDDSKRFR